MGDHLTQHDNWRTTLSGHPVAREQLDEVEEDERWDDLREDIRSHAAYVVRVERLVEPPDRRIRRAEVPAAEEDGR
jgi:hypothetical protein